MGSSYASLYFIFCVDKNSNELIVLETIHKYVLALDRYYENVCELDIIYGFDQVRVKSVVSCDVGVDGKVTGILHFG